MLHTASRNILASDIREMTVRIADLDAADMLWDWAWQAFNISFRSLPDCEHVQKWQAYNEECRKLQMCGLRLKDVLVIGRQEDMPKGTIARQQQKLVVATYEMDTDIFAKHFNGRHQASLAGLDRLPANIEFSIEQLYRAFHWRLHKTLVGLDHYHEPDPPEASVDRAIECLIDNRTWGWFELAGIEGHVAIFPDGQIATRIKGAVRHHRTIEEATDRLVGPSTPIKARSRR